MKYSDDQSKMDQGTGKYNGGVYDHVYSGRMVAEFNEFIFGKPAGSKGVVKTEFGYHYIEILSQKGGSAAYKIAYLSKPIEASQETDNNANNEAAQFAGNSRDQKSFDANAEKLLKEKGVAKAVIPGLTPSTYNLQGLGAARPLIKKVFEGKAGEVLEPEVVGNSYVVAVVTEITKEGTRPFAQVKPEIEAVLRNKKKGEMLKQKVGAVTTLEAAAAKLNGKPTETVDSLRMTGTQSSPVRQQLSNEPKILGAAFNPANKGKVVTEAIPGQFGIYVLRVDDVTATSVADANVADQRKRKAQDGKARSQSPIGALRIAASITDRRIRFF
jgi:peptidyl-prolyl cis-trans isomerase D